MQKRLHSSGYIGSLFSRLLFLIAMVVTGQSAWAADETIFSYTAPSTASSAKCAASSTYDFTSSEGIFTSGATMTFVNNNSSEQTVVSSGNGYIGVAFGSSKHFLKITFGQALQAGDKIKFTSYSSSGAEEMKIGTSTTDCSLSSSQTFTVSSGSGLVGKTTIYVTRNSNTTRLTSLSIVRPDPTAQKSTDATLSAIQYNGTAVADFAAATTSYNVTLAYGTTTVPTVTATTTDGGATTQITQATALPGSATIAVTAEDETTTKTYTVNFSVSTTAPTTPTGYTKVWKAEDWDLMTAASSVTTVNGMNVYNVAVDKGTYSGVTDLGDITKRYNFGGTGGTSSRYMKFHVDGACKIVVWTSSGSVDRNLTLSDGTTSLKTDFGKITTANEVVKDTYDYTGAAADLYAYSTSSGIYVLAIGIQPLSTTPHTVTFNAGTNGTCTTTTLTEASAGAGVTLPAATANEGYTFLGWATTEGATTANAGAAGATYKPTAACTLYAVYKSSTSTFTDFKINFTKDWASTTTISEGTTYYVTAATAEGVPTFYSTAADPYLCTFKGKYHTAAYGITGTIVFTVPVNGPVKFSYGMNDYGSDVTVTNSAGQSVGSFNTNGAKFSQDPANVKTFTYSGGADVLTFTGGGYVPYFAAEATTISTVTVTYKDQNGTEIGTKSCNQGDALGEIPSDVQAKVTVPEGSVLRGWVYSTGKKTTSADVISENTTVSALVTAKENVVAASTFTYDLTKETFYPADHEGIASCEGSWHDASHGFSFGENKSISVKVAGNAKLTFGLCKYPENGEGKITVTDASGNTVGSAFNAVVATDGTTASIDYTGAATTLTATFSAAGYLHNLKVENAAPKYTVTCNTAEHGTVTTNAAAGGVEAGTEVTITATPNGGYQLSTLAVKDASDNAVTVTNNKFTMPASNVTVTATFEAIPAPSFTKDLSATESAMVGVAKELTVVATGATSYKWFKASSSTITDNDSIPGAHSATYSYTASAAGTEYLRCAAINDGGTANSTICAVTATQPSILPFSSNPATTTAYGYGAAATGGASGTIVKVDNADDLKAALDNDQTAKTVIITKSITLTAPLKLYAVQNKTILGQQGVTLTNLTQDKDNSGIFIFSGNSGKGGSKNIIIRNLTFVGPGAYDCDGQDLLTFQGVENAWVDHCDFQDGVDDCFDIKATDNYNTDNITVSWCRFHYLRDAKGGTECETQDHRFANLVGNDPNSRPTDGMYNITWAYNWWDSGCKERMVRFRNSNMHFLNDVWSSADADYFVGPETGASETYTTKSSAIFDGCYFVKPTSPMSGNYIWRNYKPKANDTSKSEYSSETVCPVKFNSCYSEDTENGATYMANSSTLPSFTLYDYTADEASSVKTLVTSTKRAGATLNVTEAGEVSMFTTMPTYNFAVTSGGNGTATVSSATPALGEVVTFTATPSAGFEFKGWKTSASATDYVSTSATYKVSATENLSLYPDFGELTGAQEKMFPASDAGESKTGGFTYSTASVTATLGESSTTDWKIVGESKTGLIASSGTKYDAQASIVCKNTNVTYTAGGVPTAGDFASFAVSTKGTLDVAILLNSGKATYCVDKDASGACTTKTLKYYPDNTLGGVAEIEAGKSVSAKYTGFVTVPTEAGHTYYIFCTGSKMAYYGFVFTPTPAGTPEFTADIPKSVSMNVGESHTFSVAATNAQSYQWYKNTTNTVEGATAVESATAATYEYTPSATGTEYVFCKAINGTLTTNSTVCAVKTNPAGWVDLAVDFTKSWAANLSTTGAASKCWVTSIADGVPTYATIRSESYKMYFEGYYKDATYGLYYKPKFQIPVVAGSYKVSLGCSDYGDNIEIKDKNDNVLGSVSNKGSKYAQDKTAISYTYVTVSAADTLNIGIASTNVYFPYIHVESVETVPAQYTITFMNGETQVKQSKVYDGTMVGALPADPTVGDHQQFIGWYTATDGTGTFAQASDIATADVTYYANIKTVTESNGYIVAGDSGSEGLNGENLIAAIKYANANAKKVFVKNGTYDFKAMMNTEFSAANMSLIGESMEKTIVKCEPLVESINSATIKATGDNFYAQDITLQCYTPYGTGSDTKSAERGLGLWNCSKHSTLKNVYLQGTQDTYYTNYASAGQLGYVEGGRIDGTVDFICGAGNHYFNGVKLYVVNSAHRTSKDVIVAPNMTTSDAYGYVFKDAVIDGAASQKGTYFLARPWNNSPACTWIDTKLNLATAAAGYTNMTAGKVLRFHEYNTQDADGNVITSHNLDACGGAEGSNALYLTKEQAATYTISNVLGEWAATAQAEAKQVTTMPTSGTYTYLLADGTMTTTSTVPTTGIVRVANSRGGFGPEIDLSTKINVSTENVVVTPPEGLTEQQTKDAVKAAATNAAVTNMNTGITKAVDVAAVEFKDASGQKVEVPAGTPVALSLEVSCASATVQNNSGAVVTAMTFDVTPKASVEVSGQSYSTPVANDKIKSGSTITFRLPVDKNATLKYANVKHEGQYFGQMTVQTDPNSGDKYIELQVTSFSKYSYELTDEKATAIDNVEADADAEVKVSNSRKIFMNGQIVIIKDGRKFTVAGQEIE